MGNSLYWGFPRKEEVRNNSSRLWGIGAALVNWHLTLGLLGQVHNDSKYKGKIKKAAGAGCSGWLHLLLQSMLTDKWFTKNW